jgi:uncharacterized protein YndB with AHSA1/START domain
MNSSATASGFHADVPIKKSVLVAASPERAFQVFTEDMSTWWPLRSHHIGKVDAERVIIEPFVGGRWFERGVDGSECDWGKVRTWDSPRRLVLSWEITSDWRHDPSIQTEVRRSLQRRRRLHAGRFGAPPASSLRRSGCPDARHFRIGEGLDGAPQGVRSSCLGSLTL